MYGYQLWRLSKIKTHRKEEFDETLKNFES